MFPIHQHNSNYPSHNPNNPNLFTPLPTNPVSITYPSKEVYEKINNSINLLANAVTIAYKRGIYTKEETVIINKCFKTLTTHPSKWN